MHSNMATTAWTRLVLTFERDEEVNVANIHKCLRQTYDIGYTGLFVSEYHKLVFLQTSNLRVRMSPKKVRKLLRRFGNIHGVETFSHFEGICMEDVGEYRTAGGNKRTRIEPVADKRQPSPAKNTASTSKKATPKTPKHTPAQKKEFCEDDDPVFFPVYTGFGGDWKVVSWNRATKKAKRQDCTKFREQVLHAQDHKCNYCACKVSFGQYSNADMDHIIPLNAGGDQEISNVHALCTPCHRRKTALESQRFTTTLGAIMSVAYRPSERRDIQVVGSNE